MYQASGTSASALPPPAPADLADRRSNYPPPPQHNPQHQGGTPVQGNPQGEGFLGYPPPNFESVPPNNLGRHTMNDGERRYPPPPLPGGDGGIFQGGFSAPPSSVGADAQSYQEHAQPPPGFNPSQLPPSMPRPGQQGYPPPTFSHPGNVPPPGFPLGFPPRIPRPAGPPAGFPPHQAQVIPELGFPAQPPLPAEQGGADGSQGEDRNYGVRKRRFDQPPLPSTDEGDTSGMAYERGSGAFGEEREDGERSEENNWGQSAGGDQYEPDFGEEGRFRRGGWKDVTSEQVCIHSALYKRVILELQ